MAENCPAYKAGMLLPIHCEMELPSLFEGESDMLDTFSTARLIQYVCIIMISTNSFFYKSIQNLLVLFW